MEACFVYGILYGALDLDLAMVLLVRLHERGGGALAIQYLVLVRPIRVLPARNPVTLKEFARLRKRIEREFVLNERKLQFLVPVCV